MFISVRLWSVCLQLASADPGGVKGVVIGGGGCNHED